MWGPRVNANSDSIDPAALIPGKNMGAPPEMRRCYLSMRLAGRRANFSYFDLVGPNDRRPLCKAK